MGQGIRLLTVRFSFIHTGFVHICRSFTSLTASYAAPGRLASKLHAAASSSTGIKAHSPLSFLNTWTYKLGTDVLTPFGRQQLFDLGVSMRVKYGSLLEGFTNVGAHVYWGHPYAWHLAHRVYF